MANDFVLVVDDEMHIRQVVSMKLRAAGIETQSACQGVEAMDIARARTPTLVVTDFQMPGMDGLQLATTLASEAATQRVPVILLTARGHRVSPSELGATNIQLVMDKPFSPRQLLESVRELLNASDATEAAA